MSTMLPVKINASGELAVARCQCASTALPCADSDAAPVPQATPAKVEREKGSYSQILKSSALVGGSQVANVVIGIVRTKAMAMLLGPAGFGLFGLYASIQNLAQSIAGMGINSSGVRQIAEAVGTGDKDRIARTAAVLRRTAVLLGVLGAALLVLFSRQISGVTFGSTERARAVSLLSLAVLFGLISGGQGALIQGMRRIADLAKMNVLGAFFGLCAAVPLVYFFGQQGVVPSLVVVAATGILTSWWYSRKIDIQPTVVALTEVRQEACALLKLGSAFMVSGLITLGVAYGVRVMILQQLGLQATGLYQSAWTLGGLYVGFILQAMGADFYPRLTASIHNHEVANRLVNEQMLIGLLLAGPGVVATLTCAPTVIAVLYSAKFGGAVPVLRWICLGATLQVITWPMGFIIVAKGKQNLFLLSEVVWGVASIALAWSCIHSFGLEGAGIAFFASYIVHGFVTYRISRYLTGFRWSSHNKRTGAMFLSLVAAVFCAVYFLPLVAAVSLGLATLAGTVIHSVRVLMDIITLDELPRPIGRLLRLFGFRSALPGSAA
jgi:enterobacterial common antigen flippase